ncbi:MAG: hypothetical protein M3Y54_22255 [Bacteroidota bacterium]|nr:hypothetical protein [Bacteroidota bacterium]
MDIDLLSNRWQQHTPAPAANRYAPLAGPRPTPLTQMRRNVRVEIWTTLAVGILLLLGLYGLRSTHLGRLLALLLPLYGGIGYCYYRLVQVLRRLRATTGPVAGHVAAQLRQLRQLMRVYYGSTMLSTLAVLGVLGYLTIAYALPHVPPTGRTQFLTWLLLTAAISAGFTHWFCRYHIQNFYGQNLDRLEAVLHELHELHEE